MSVTTTENARLITLRQNLDIQNPQPATSHPAPSPSSHPQPTPQAPSDWETNWRRVPAYRPVNPELIDQEGRNEFNNAIERNFIRVMFGGVWLQAASAQAWRATGGRLFGDGVFRVRVGGEW